MNTHKINDLAKNTYYTASLINEFVKTNTCIEEIQTIAPAMEFVTSNADMLCAELLNDIQKED